MESKYVAREYKWAGAAQTHAQLEKLGMESAEVANLAEFLIDMGWLAQRLDPASGRIVYRVTNGGRATAGEVKVKWPWEMSWRERHPHLWDMLTWCAAAVGGGLLARLLAP